MKKQEENIPKTHSEMLCYKMDHCHIVCAKNEEKMSFGFANNTMVLRNENKSNISVTPRYNGWRISDNIITCVCNCLSSNLNAFYNRMVNILAK